MTGVSATPEPLRIFWDDELLVPREGDGSPSPHVESLIDEGTTLYVDPTAPELVAHLPGKTSIRGDGDQLEDFYVQYRTETAAQLFHGFGSLIEHLHQSQGMWGVSDTPDESTFSEAVIDSGVLDEFWHFQNPDAGVVDAEMPLFPRLFTDIDGTLPPLKAVHRRALLELLRDADETLQLGVEDFRTGLEILAFAVESEFETSFAICESTDAAHTFVDVLLVPGNRNFEALDESTRTALKQSFEAVTENLQEWFTQRGVDAIRELVEDDAITPVTTLRDVETIVNYIEHDIGGGIRTDIGKALVKDYNEIAESDHLSDTERDEIRETLLAELKTERETLVEQVTQEKSDELTGYIRQIDDLAIDENETYRYYRLLDDVLDETRREEIDLGARSLPEPVVEFVETYRGVVSSTGPTEAVEAQVREWVQRELDSYLAETGDQIVGAAVQEFERLIHNVALPNDTLSKEQRLHVLTLTQSTLQDASALETLSAQYGKTKHVGTLVERLEELRNREAIDETTAERIESQVDALCTDQIESVETSVKREYGETLEAAVQDIVQDDVSPEEKAARLGRVMRILRGKPPDDAGSRATAVQRVHTTVQRLNQHESLDEDLKDEVREAVLSYVEDLEAQVSAQGRDHQSENYLQEMRQQLDVLAKEQSHAPEYIVETLDELERIVDDKQYLDPSVLHHDNKYVRMVSSILHDEFEDRVMGDDETAAILDEIASKRSIYSTDDQADPGTLRRVLNGIPGVVKWGLVAAVMLLVLLVAILAVLWWTGDLSAPPTQATNPVVSTLWSTA